MEMESSATPLIFSMDTSDLRRKGRIGDGGFENMVGPRIMPKRREGTEAYTLT